MLLTEKLKGCCPKSLTKIMYGTSSSDRHWIVDLQSETSKDVVSTHSSDEHPFVALKTDNIVAGSVPSEFPTSMSPC